jgi:hypothetical protein
VHDERAAAPADPIDQVVQPCQLVGSAEKLDDSRVVSGSRGTPPPATLPRALKRGV